MAEIRQEIVEEFCRRLGESEEFSLTMVQQLRELLRPGQKPKPVDVMKVLAAASGDDVP